MPNIIRRRIAQPDPTLNAQIVNAERPGLAAVRFARGTARPTVFPGNARSWRSMAGWHPANHTRSAPRL